MRTLRTLKITSVIQGMMLLCTFIAELTMFNEWIDISKFLDTVLLLLHFPALFLSAISLLCLIAGLAVYFYERRDVSAKKAIGLQWLWFVFNFIICTAAWLVYLFAFVGIAN